MQERQQAVLPAETGPPPRWTRVSVPRLPLRWPELSPAWQLSLWLLLTMRLALELVGFTSARLDPIRPRIIPPILTQQVIQSDKPWSQLLSIWQRWDALWYEYVIRHGYHAYNDTIHFQPL